jgi:hypothetical protein
MDQAFAKSIGSVCRGEMRDGSTGRGFGVGVIAVEDVRDGSRADRETWRTTCVTNSMPASQVGYRSVF